MNKDAQRSSRLPMLALLSATVLFVATAPAGAQVVNPATANQQPEAQDPQTGLKSYNMPPVTVYGKAPLAEEDRIGDYAQPRWTAARRFSETRVYVIPKGQAEFEYWLKPQVHKNGEPTEFETLYEAEFGLPARFQLDLYAVGTKVGADGDFGITGQKAEVRWAFADWNKIWGNPTAYAEWAENSGGHDTAEFKLLLGGEIVSRWHWGSNLVWEHTLGETRETSREWTTGISYSAKDMKVAVGAETQLAFVDELEAGSTTQRTDMSHEFLVGPSFQFRPVPQMHIDFAPLFGTTKAALRSKTFIVVGWEF